MAKRKLLKEKDVPFFPVTVSDAVIFEEGKSLDEKIYELEDTIANLPEVPEIPEIPDIPDTSGFMLASVYQDDEEVIAAAFNNLNDRINALNVALTKRDNRLYNNGAILDLTGENNPNYSWSDNDERILNETCFNAIKNNQIGIIFDQIESGQAVPLFAVASPLDEYGNALQGKHEFVLMTIPSGNMSEGGRYFEAQSSINWYNAFYGLLIDDSTGVISEIPWSNVQPDTPDEPYEPDEPIDDEPIEPEEEN